MNERALTWKTKAGNHLLQRTGTFASEKKNDMWHYTDVIVCVRFSAPFGFHGTFSS